MSVRFHTLLCAFMLAALGLTGFVSASAASAASAGWRLSIVSDPSSFSTAGEIGCFTNCDRYQILPMNVGGAASSGALTLTDHLPAGITTSGETTEKGRWGKHWECPDEGVPGLTVVTCTYEGEPVAPGDYATDLEIPVGAPPSTMHGTAVNTVTLEATGGGKLAEASLESPLNAESTFEVNDFGFEADREDGTSETQAGAHPFSLTTTVGIPAVRSTRNPVSGEAFSGVGELKDVSVELPYGFVGDPQTTAKCTEAEFKLEACPPASRIGSFAVAGGFRGQGNFGASEDGTGCCSAVYNMVPQGNYPAEFGLSYATIALSLYATLVRGHANTPEGPRGYRLRVVAPSIPGETSTTNAALTLFGEPGGLTGSPLGEPFLTNPAACSTGPSSARIEVEAWGKPGEPQTKETAAYPSLGGCDLLQWNPTLAFQPSAQAEGGTSQADAPSGFTADLKVPQSSRFSELATPNLKTATVTLPPGVSIDPSAGNGLAGCQATGPEGINIGSEDLGPKGQDIGDPEATELGEGHEGPGGNSSPYDDGYYHTAPGHCPAASQVGTAEVFTPLLPAGPHGEAPLTGRLYVATPKCGGAGQNACTEASASNGELFGGYLEAEGSGVIVKLAGTFSVNPQTGQLTASFQENPQVPFSELKLHVDGGPRAPLANPQTCGTATTSSSLEPWSAPVTPNALVSDSYAVTGCGGGMGFAPSFVAHTVTPTAGAFSPFVLSFGRHDGEQDLSGLSVTLPQGMLAKLAGVPLCGEAEANAGTCGAASQIGTTSATAGAGEDPLPVTGGRVYLTTGYKGQPFGLSVVVPAVAGPFNLGNVVVRAAIHVNPSNAQVTVVSDPLPQIKDGVPLRIRTVNVEINRPGFTFNPTNCNQQSVAGTIAAAQGASSNVSVPFAVANCANLPFKPGLSVSTQGKASKAGGASLDLKLTSSAGQANVAKFDFQLPKQLPSRLTTLQKACTEAQFNANPAGCPVAADIGTATVSTPVLSNPLSGPIYLVSHGGEAFPDTEVILQGEGVSVVLDGKTQIKGGVTYSHFETVPDVPFTSFEAKLPEGKFSIFGANLAASAKYNFCAQKLTLPATITGQNGAVIKPSTKIGVTGCAKAKKASKKKTKKKSKKHGAVKKKK